MSSRRATLLTILLCLLVAAPAAASERSEARQYAAAMHGLSTLTAEEAEALVAGMEARSAHVVATCLPAVEAAARKERRRDVVSLLYEAHVAAEPVLRFAAWMREGDDALAAVETRSRVLRRGRAGRRGFTRVLRGMGEAAPPDFCATLTAWEARGFKGVPAEAKALVAQVLGLLEGAAGFRRWERAAKVLKRHGASRAQRRAFVGEPDWPALREPAPDPVAQLLEPKRGGSDGAGSRQPWAAASGAHAG